MTKRVLGRGLGALLTDSAAEDAVAPREGIVEALLAEISPNPFQPRKSIPDEKIRELADSIREKGLLQPVILRRVAEGGYQIVAGERRCRAARALGHTTIPAVVRDVPDRELLEVALIENIQREDLDEIEVASALDQLMRDCGYTHQQLAMRVGKDRVSITNTLRLLKLADPVKAAITSREITAGHARALVGLDDAAAQVSWCNRIVREGLSVRAVEALLATAPGPKKRKARPARRHVEDPMLRAMNEKLQTALGTKTTIRRIGRGGRIEIDFYSPEELERLLEFLLEVRP